MQLFSPYEFFYNASKLNLQLIYKLVGCLFLLGASNFGFAPGPKKTQGRPCHHVAVTGHGHVGGVEEVEAPGLRVGVAADDPAMAGGGGHDGAGVGERVPEHVVGAGAGARLRIPREDSRAEDPVPRAEGLGGDDHAVEGDGPGARLRAEEVEPDNVDGVPLVIELETATTTGKLNNVEC